ncbi:hypothetical protein BpHYR1_038148, partial [Brachionus plicatilis]
MKNSEIKRSSRIKLSEYVNFISWCIQGIASTKKSFYHHAKRVYSNTEFNLCNFINQSDKIFLIYRIREEKNHKQKIAKKSFYFELLIFYQFTFIYKIQNLVTNVFYAGRLELLKLEEEIFNLRRQINHAKLKLATDIK